MKTVSSNSLPLSSPSAPPGATVVLPILFAVSLGHLLNDTIQAILPAIYPVLKDSFGLNFTQIGQITLAFQLTASILQPCVGLISDRRHLPFSLAAGAVFTLLGIVLLSLASSFAWVLVAALLIGIGSSIFHPEASRVARMASGGQHGFAQSIFQVGGNTGSALGPLLAALVIAHRSQAFVAWFAFVPVVAFFAMLRVGRWYRDHLVATAVHAPARPTPPLQAADKRRIAGAIAVLLVLIFSKFFYMACLGSYYTFYLIDKFHVSVQASQLYLFAFIASTVAGTFVGGPLGDRIGRKAVIWLSILGAAPFALLLPHASLFWCSVLSICAGLVLSSAFSSILVYAQELIPQRVGLISGLFFGLAFGMGGVGSAALGKLADRTSIDYVFQVCAFLPLLGLCTALLPKIPQRRAA